MIKELNENYYALFVFGWLVGVALELSGFTMHRVTEITILLFWAPALIKGIKRYKEGLLHKITVFIIAIFSFVVVSNFISAIFKLQH